jgi:hypothetical protein
MMKLTEKPIARTGDYYFLNSLIIDLNQIPSTICHIILNQNIESIHFEHGIFYLIENRISIL